MRRDLRPLGPADPLIVELRMLTAHRTDLAIDRTRAINRLRARLLAICPELEATLNFTCHGPLLLIAEFPTAAAVRALGRDELHHWLRAHNVRNTAALATRAHDAAGQQVQIPGEDVAATLIARLARTVLALNRELAELDARIADRFRTHRHAPVVTSMMGVGDLLGAQFLAATGGDKAALSDAPPTCRPAAPRHPRHPRAAPIPRARRS